MDQLFALLRDTWEGVVQPLVEAIWKIATSSPVGFLVALIIVGFGVYAYQEAKR